MMGEMLRRVCILSVTFGVAATLINEKSVAQIMRILCTCVLIICVLEPLKQMDFESFSVDMAEYREREKALLESGEDMRRRLDRTVIEEEYAAYIIEKAEETGIEITNARVGVQWDTEGIWVPYEAYIESESDGIKTTALKKLIKAELGIPEERQTWIQTGN